jgi:hypothetical protein
MIKATNKHREHRAAAARLRRKPVQRKPVQALPEPPTEAIARPTPSKRRRWVYRDGLGEYTGNRTYVTVWRWMSRGMFPLPYIVGESNAWDEEELLAWQNSRPRKCFGESEIA